MFVIATIADTIRIPPSMFFQSTRECAHQEIDKKYPNRVIMDVGLVICRYGDVTQIGDGVCVPGDGAAHHEVVFRLVIFRPFVEEVCLGHILESNEEGIKVGLGDFFSDIFIPAYWMLRPSQYDKESGLWVWTPDYGDDDEGEGQAEEQRYEMYIGAEIRFKVKGINFTQVTNTAKGIQATTTSTTSKLMPSFNSSIEGTASDLNSGDDKADNRPVRKRSSSIDLSYCNVPPCMHITASICEDGLGLVSWWTNQEDGGEEIDQDDDGVYEGEEQLME
jgi:DNA-directed RNA polymerase III subunit RPC8